MTMNNKVDTRKLKAKHRLELVMQDTGEKFDADAANPDLWHSVTTHGLTVDTKRQRYEYKRPGMDTEAGDVIAWIQLRYAWSFSMAIKFLQKRTPDPKQETQPAKIAKRKQKKNQENDFVTTTKIYTDPATGAESYAVSYNYEIMDNLQQRALDLWHGAVEYFDKSSETLWDKLQKYPHRFKQIVDSDIEKCASCETPFNWQNPGTFAYAQEEETYPDFYAGCDDHEELDIEVNIADPIFCDSDFVICEKCLRGKYTPRYKALKLVWRSAYKRKEAKQEEQRQRNHEAWLEAEREREREEERLNVEACYRDSAAGGAA